MDLRTIKKLIELVEASDKVTELSVEHEGISIRIGAHRGNGITQTLAPSAPSTFVIAPETASIPQTTSPTAIVPEGTPVRSPMVGVFYASPAPGSAPFVHVGKSIRAGETLCIIEAMKMMNHLKAETSGRITQILVENGQAVEYDQILFYLEPATVTS